MEVKEEVKDEGVVVVVVCSELDGDSVAGVAVVVYSGSKVSKVVVLVLVGETVMVIVCVP